VKSETLLILNPASGRGSAGRLAEGLVARAEVHCGPLSVATTAGPGDAIGLAAEAAARGVARILVAGGDGTVGEVVSGLMTAPGPAAGASTGAASRPALGILPVGSGCDLARTLALPRQIDAALEVIAAGHLRLLDVGRVESGGRGADRSVRYFANEVSAGLSSDTVRRVDRLSPRLGPRAGFLLGAVSLFVAANGCYFGAGMRVAPEAALDDGRLEVVLARGLSRPELLANLPAFYVGRHGRHPQVSFHSARSVRLIPETDETTAEIDGEGGLALPLRIECLPAALRVLSPAVTVPLAQGRVVALRPAARLVAPVALGRDRG
jgi:diacylglycerol kinase family enzyme